MARGIAGSKRHVPRLVSLGRIVGETLGARPGRPRNRSRPTESCSTERTNTCLPDQVQNPRKDASIEMSRSIGHCVSPRRAVLEPSPAAGYVATAVLRIVRRRHRLRGALVPSMK
jgi:hypothetical protein